RKNLAAIEKLIGSALPPETIEGLETQAAEENDAPARQSHGRRDRGKGRDRTPRPRPGAPEAATSPVAPQGERTPRSERAPRPDREPRHERDRNNRRPARYDHEPEGPPVLGLGAHVPAFLLQPLRPPRSREEDAELVEAS